MTRGGRSVQAAAGAQEQTGTDSTAGRDHLDLPRLQALVVALVLRVKKGLGGMCLGGDSVVRNG